jgi:hypothetical protein
MESTTSQMLMTIKVLCSVRSLVVLVCLFVFVSGCASTLPVEGPICLPYRPVLTDISVEDQRWLKKENSSMLETISLNDAALKSHVVLLERLIDAHDEPLGSCD